jgi:putative phosphoesterase
MQKIAVLSDIHGNIAALEKVVEDLRTRQVERVFNLGDHASGPLWPKETVRFLMEQDWLQIKGNHERQLTTQNPADHSPSDAYAFRQLNEVELDWLRNLPAGLKIGDEFLLVHGSPSSDTTYLLETIEHGRGHLASLDEIQKRLGEATAPVILCGHTHQPRVVKLPGSGLIVNPGSVGLPAYSDNQPERHVMESGSPHARYAILEFKQGVWVPEIIAVPYDHHKAVDQAHKNNRPDWEIALRTGFMQ